MSRKYSINLFKLALSVSVLLEVYRLVSIHKFWMDTRLSIAYIFALIHIS